MFKSILFDFDGVLADTEKFTRELISGQGVHISDETFKSHYDGNVFEKPAIHFEQAGWERFDTEYQEGIEKCRPFYTAKELAALKAKYAIYLVSSNKARAINKYLEYYGLDHIFNEVLGNEFHKSKVEKFKHVIQRDGLNPDECVLITDTLGDILEANKAGIKTIAIEYGFHDRERLQKGKPYKILPTPASVIQEF